MWCITVSPGQEQPGGSAEYANDYAIQQEDMRATARHRTDLRALCRPLQKEWSDGLRRPAHQHV